MRERTIVAIGGLPTEPGNRCLEAYLISLTKKTQARVCFVPTASGDRAEDCALVQARFGGLACDVSVLHLFDRRVKNLADELSKHDLVVVGGGNAVNLCAVWRAHGFDEALAKVASEGVVLAGWGAGALAWFESGLTDGYGPPLQRFQSGLGLLKGSFCPHFSQQKGHREEFSSLVASKKLSDGLAADDGVALLFRDQELIEVVSASEEHQAYRVHAAKKGAVVDELGARTLVPAKSTEKLPAPTAKQQGRVVAYTDGACSGNPGPGGWAWAVEGGNFDSGAEQHTTNQRMEVTAAYRAVLAHPGAIEVVSDSTYVVNCFKQRWWEGWLKRGWINSQRRPVANRDLWEPFINLVRERGNVTFRWVKGHSKDRMNQLVDQLAVEASQMQRGRSGPCPRP